MDVVMTGGWVVDGTGAPAYRADLAVDKGVVAAIGRLQHVEAAQRIDCTGLYLLPGFVDAHVHGDAAVFDPEVQLAALSQGQTTVHDLLASDDTAVMLAIVWPLRAIANPLLEMAASGLLGGVVYAGLLLAFDVAGARQWLLARWPGARKLAQAKASLP